MSVVVLRALVVLLWAASTAVQGTAPAKAVSDAHAKMVQIFNQQGLKQ